VRTQTTQLRHQKNSKKPRDFSVRGEFRNTHACALCIIRVLLGEDVACFVDESVLPSALPDNPVGDADGSG
jgi:hypothetical protein